MRCSFPTGRLMSKKLPPTSDVDAWQELLASVVPLKTRVKSDRPIPKRMKLAKAIAESSAPFDFPVDTKPFIPDPALKKRMREGGFAIDAKLDLHGMTEDHAYERLKRFIGEQKRNNARMVLVVTGKGSGILREALPRWLATDMFSGAVLTVQQAAKQHGGEGAYYVMMRRKK
jgi:DNA-nicking Smr family endonuclease